VFTEQTCDINIHANTYEYALHFCTIATYFPSICEMIHDIVTFWLEHFSNSILHTARSRVLLEKLTGSQIVKKFPTFYGTRNSYTHPHVIATCPYPLATSLLLWCTLLTPGQLNPHINKYTTNPLQVYHKHNI